MSKKCRTFVVGIEKAVLENPENPDRYALPEITFITRESFGDLCAYRTAVPTKAKHKTFKIMSKINLEIIDQMFSAQLSANESKERIDALRPQVEQAVQALIAERGLPRNFTGIIEYHGFKIRVQRPKSYTWELNTHEEVTSDPNHAIYLQQLDLQKRINDQLKDMRADVKRTAEKLAAAHPDSESIKYGFTIALMQ